MVSTEPSSVATFSALIVLTYCITRSRISFAVSTPKWLTRNVTAPERIPSAWSTVKPSIYVFERRVERSSSTASNKSFAALVFSLSETMFEYSFVILLISIESRTSFAAA